MRWPSLGYSGETERLCSSESQDGWGRMPHKPFVCGHTFKIRVERRNKCAENVN